MILDLVSFHGITIKYIIFYLILFLYFKLSNLAVLFNIKKFGYYQAPDKFLHFTGTSKILKPIYHDFKYENMDLNFSKSIPIIIRNIDKDVSSSIDHMFNTERILKNNNINIEFVNILDLMNTKYGRWILKQSNTPILYSGIFRGKYISGITHIDISKTYNFYYMRKGIKEVLIIPLEFEKYVNMSYGIHNVYVRDETSNSHNISTLKWLDNIPYYYRFYLKEGEILIFNNSGCLHKFVNKTPNNIALTSRVLNFNWGTSELIKYNMLTNNKVVETAAKALINNGSNDPSDKY
jgi:hypothetical protein